MYVGFLCLLLGACTSFDTAEDNSAESPGPTIPLDEFALKLDDKSTNKNNFVVATITPGSPSMHAAEFEVTASIAGNKGTAHGAIRNEAGNLDYKANLDDCCVMKLDHKTLSAQQNHHGAPLKFRIQAKPNMSIKQGETYTLVIKVARKEVKPHTETKSITLTAKQGGTNTPNQIEEELSYTSLRASSTALNAMPDSAILSVDHPMPTEDTRTPMGEGSTPGANPQTLEAEISILRSCSVLEDTIPRSTELPNNNTTDATSNETDTNDQKATSHTFTVTLHNETWGNHTKNFVNVTINPSNDGMAPRDFLVSATLAENQGSVKGSSDKKHNRFIYDTPLDFCSLATLFLTNVNCLGAQDTSFAKGREIVFRIEVKPEITISSGTSYTLTVTVAYQGNNAHTVAQDIELKVPTPSPRKIKK